MKIAYFGGDWHLGCIDVFKQNGHDIGHFFIHQEMPYNQNLRDYAQSNEIQVTSVKPDIKHLQQIVDDGIDCFFSVEYPWLIPVPEKSVRTINVHPTFLPEGRGPTPIIWLLKQYPEHAGITFHKLAQEFDTGDIIYQKPLEMSEHESYETWMAKLHFEVPIQLDHLLSQFNHYYQSASPQLAGSYWSKIGLKDRTINWHEGVYHIDRLVRACGRFGAVTNIKDEAVLVNNVQTSLYHHPWVAGTLLREDEQTYVIAASDGIVVLMKSDIIERMKIA